MIIACLFLGGFTTLLRRKEQKRLSDVGRLEVQWLGCFILELYATLVFGLS